jgi:hypothetical protein
VLACEHFLLLGFWTPRAHQILTEDSNLRNWKSVRRTAFYHPIHELICTSGRNRALCASQFFRICEWRKEGIMDYARNNRACCGRGRHYSSITTNGSHCIRYIDSLCSSSSKTSQPSIIADQWSARCAVAKLPCEHTVLIFFLRRQLF